MVLYSMTNALKFAGSMFSDREILSMYCAGLFFLSRRGVEKGRG